MGTRLQLTLGVRWWTSDGNFTQTKRFSFECSQWCGTFYDSRGKVRPARGPTMTGNFSCSNSPKHSDCGCALWFGNPVSGSDKSLPTTIPFGPPSRRENQSQVETQLTVLNTATIHAHVRPAHNTWQAAIAIQSTGQLPLNSGPAWGELQILSLCFQPLGGHSRSRLRLTRGRFGKWKVVRLRFP